MASETRSYGLLYDEEGIRADLKQCREKDRYAFNHIVAVLGELRGNTSLSENFTIPGWQDATIEDVVWIESLQAEGINATRVKLWEVKQWRLIFFVDHTARVAAFVAVMHRDQDYQNDHSLWERLRNAYERLGFH